MSQMTNLFGGGNTSNQPQVNTGYTGSPNPQVSGAYGQALGNYQNILGQYSNLYNQAGANQGGYVQSVVDPTIQTNASQYGNLMQDQANRGVRGSSFGDQSISNFTNAANTNVQNATSNALQQSYGLQSGILGNQANVNQAMTSTAGGLGSYLNQLQGMGLNYNLGVMQNNLANSKANAGMFGGLMNGLSGMNWSGLMGSGAGAASSGGSAMSAGSGISGVSDFGSGMMIA